MASGTINGITANDYIVCKIEWTSASNGSVANSSTVTAKLYFRRTNSGYTTQGDKYFTITINGTSYASAHDNMTIGTSWVLAQTATATVQHNNDGAKSITISASGYLSGSSLTSTTCSGTATLDTIPRYATCTQSNTAKTETTITIKWTSDSTISLVRYSANGGATWVQVTAAANATSGTYTITGLNANQTYSVKTEVTRKDSGLPTATASMNVTTYAYPYCSKLSNFTIGNTAVALTFYNPLSRSCTVTMMGGSTAIASFTIAGTSYAYNSVPDLSAWYATIPAATSGAYSVVVTYAGQTATKTGGAYMINKGACHPTITAVTYADQSSAVVAITGDNQKIVRNQSAVRFTATGIGGIRSATIASVTLAVNGVTHNMAESGSSYVCGNYLINSATNVTATCTVTDSRGLQSTATCTVTMLDWIKPTAIINMSRQNNFYTTTSINVDADYSSLDGNNTITITYRAGIQGSGAYSVTGTLQDNVPSTFEADNEQNWSVQVTVADLFDSTTYTLSLSRGIPIVFYDVDKSSVGVNTFPTHDDSLEALDIYTNGDLIADVVVEQGTSGNWYYRKWQSGRCDCYMRLLNQTFSIATAKGSLYAAANYSEYAYPFTIYDGVAEVMFGFATTAYMVWAASIQAYDTAVRFWPVSSGSVASVGNVRLGIHISGRWK